MIFSISVVIPAYNVERFIEKAITSVIQQLEVSEILVVNDGSTDNTLTIVEKLQKQYPIIKIYHHQNKINKGRSATRNLGIQKATTNYIAFLDADDFYLEGRFFNDKKIFMENESTDGVYNAVGFHFYREATNLEKEKLVSNTISRKIEPEALFEAVISNKYGYLHLNGITVKKKVFDSIGLFNEQLMVAEDSDIIFKMAIKCRLESGNISQPLALRGIHETNVFNNTEVYKKYIFKLYESLLSWSKTNKISVKTIDVIFNWLWVVRFREKYKLSKDIMYWGYLFLPNPKFMFSYLSIKYFPIIRLRQKFFPFLFK